MSKGKKRSGARPGRPQPLRAPEQIGRAFSRNDETDLVCRHLLEKKNIGA
nr:phage DNA packaging protein J [Staphylococcus haemolyticus]